MKYAGRIAQVAAGLMLASASAHAQNSYGMANVSCSQYLRAARTSDILYHQASNWLLGYLSGMNGALKAVQGQAPPIALTNDQVLKSAGDYCQANPSHTLAQAAGEWYAMLPKQADTKQAEPSRGWTIDLNASPKYRPLIDRR